MENTASDLINSADLVIFDSDGVLVQEGDVLPGATTIVEKIKQKGKKCVVLSNNSTKHPDTMLETFHSQNIMVDDVVNSGILTVEYCKEEGINSTYVVGEQGLIDLLEENGIDVSEDANDAVIVGMDRTLTYHKLVIATRLILEGRKFIGTNPDNSFPTPRGLEPGAGSMIAALEASTESKPITVLGKPETFGYEYILDEYELSNDRVVMVGDRYETDILGAINANIPAFVVNTGVANTRKIPNSWKEYPKVPIVQSLEDITL